MKRTFLIPLLTSLFYIGFGQANDTVAIKQLLEKESATWRAGDIKGHADCWHIQPYSKVLASTDDGHFFDIPPERMIDPSPNSMGKGGSAVNSNYKMNIHGNDAWVSHNEESTSKDGKKTYSYEIRILEKIEGEWKLVAESIHIYKPK
ncbi:MAG: endo-arabinase [Bacteroidetes bacterium]|nr:endo-arabinase [Bacteroidota bacterium]